MDNKTSNNKDYKKLYEQNIKHHNDLQRERLEDYILNDRLKKDVDLLHNKVDELEAKNYQLKADIDRIIKAIEYYKNNINLNNKGDNNVN